MHNEGLLLVVSGPSGAGKGTLLNYLKQLNHNLLFSVSATTRLPREGEVDGRNYFFKTVDEFEAMIKDEELVEWVKYCNNYYGTPRKYIEESVKNGSDVILEIEVEGAQAIKDKFPQSVLIFIAPPSFEELRRRIEGRGTEKADVIEQRLLKARKEILLVENYDYIVVNNDLQNAVNDINCIIKAEKLKPLRNKCFINNMGI